MCPHQTNPRDGLHAEQPFQKGHMFWSEIEQLYLIVIGSDRGYWQVEYENEKTWKEGMPEKSCEENIPEGFIQPVRGFGELWCRLDDVHAAIGWATDDESGFDKGKVLIQVFDGGIIYRDSKGDAYILFKDDMSFVREPY